MTKPQQPTHNAADPALRDLLLRAVALDTSSPHQWPEAALVYQANTADHTDTQFRVAAAAHRELGWRVLCIRMAYSREELEALAARGAELEEGLTFEVVYEWGEQPRASAAVTLSGSQPLQLLGGGFDLVIIEAGYTHKLWSLHQTLSEKHRPARALLFWSEGRPGDTTAPAATSEALTVYPWPALELDYRRGDAERLRGALSCYPLGRLNWGLTKFLGYAAETYAPWIYGPGIKPDRAMLEGHSLAYPYEALPAPHATKAARVRAVTTCTVGLRELSELTREWRPAESGMYVVVPDSFADECDVEATPFGYFAYHGEGHDEHLFHVWPAPLLRKAEADYAAAFESGLLIPQLVGATVRTPSYWKPVAAGSGRHEGRLPEHIWAEPPRESLTASWLSMSDPEHNELTTEGGASADGGTRQL